MSRTFKGKSFGLIDIPYMVPTHSHKKSRQIVPGFLFCMTCR